MGFFQVDVTFNCKVAAHNIIEHHKVYFVVSVVYSINVNDNGTFHWPKMKGTSVSIKNSENNGLIVSVYSQITKAGIHMLTILPY